MPAAASCCPCSFRWPYRSRAPTGVGVRAGHRITPRRGGEHSARAGATGISADRATPERTGVDKAHWIIPPPPVSDSCDAQGGGRPRVETTGRTTRQGGEHMTTGNWADSERALLRQAAIRRLVQLRARDELTASHIATVVTCTALCRDLASLFVVIEHGAVPRYAPCRRPPAGSEADGGTAGLRGLHRSRGGSVWRMASERVLAGERAAPGAKVPYEGSATRRAPTA